MRARVSGTPQWLLNDLSEACTLPTDDRTWRIASLVVVLPAEPVTAITFALVRARAAAPVCSSAASTSGTTIIGIAIRPSEGSRASETTSSSAPAAIAAVAKSWPSNLSPLMAKKASPGRSVRVSIEMPETPSGRRPTGRPSIAATSASDVQRWLMRPSPSARAAPPRGRRNGA